MLNLKLIAIGKIKNKYFSDAIAEYRKRIKPYARLEVVELKEESFTKSNQVKAKEIEGQKIIEALEKENNAFIIALDETGEEFSSPEFANLLNSKPEKIIFIIGGSLGLADEVIKKSHKKISLSRLTFTHEMARLFLFEQIYRATTIVNKKDYHH